MRTTILPKFIFIVPVALLLSACAAENSPFSAFGFGASKEPIDYSPRAPLVMPPPEQRGQLPPPQDGQAQAYVQPQPAPQDVEIAPPPEQYGQNTPGAVVEEKSWWQRHFGND